MKCVAVTPEKTVVEQEVKFVVAPLFDGEYGIGEGHSAVVGRLGAGELRLTCADDSVEKWYVEGGFVEVADNVVSLLTNFACLADSLDLDEAKARLEAALKLQCDAETKGDAIRIARARLRVAEKVVTERK